MENFENTTTSIVHRYGQSVKSKYKSVLIVSAAYQAALLNLMVTDKFVHNSKPLKNEQVHSGRS